jgi:hypothetical protein
MRVNFRWADFSYQQRKHMAIPELTNDLARQIIATVSHSW